MDSSIYLLLGMMKDQEEITQKILRGEADAATCSSYGNFVVNVPSINTVVFDWPVDFEQPLKNEKPIEVQEKDLLPEEPVSRSQWKVEED